MHKVTLVLFRASLKMSQEDTDYDPNHVITDIRLQYLVPAAYRLPMIPKSLHLGSNGSLYYHGVRDPPPKLKRTSPSVPGAVTFDMPTPSPGDAKRPQKTDLNQPETKQETKRSSSSSSSRKGSAIPRRRHYLSAPQYEQWADGKLPYCFRACSPGDLVKLYQDRETTPEEDKFIQSLTPKRTKKPQPKVLEDRLRKNARRRSRSKK